MTYTLFNITKQSQRCNSWVWSFRQNASYKFTQLAVQLNEPEPGVAPTDSRLRPDLRLMEEGEMDEADKVKVLLEEKQRSARRRRQSTAATKGLDPERQSVT